MPQAAVEAVGAALRRAREHKGLSQAELAKRVGKSQAAISLWEQGRRSPDLHDLVQLVGLLDLDLDQVVSRALPRQAARAVLRAEAARVVSEEFADAVDQLMTKAEEVGRPPAELRIRNDSAIGAAQELLAKAKVVKPPVPVDALARRAGIRVFEFGASTGVSGLLLELESGPVIGYSESDGRARQRFTVAHELGHYLLRHHDHFHIDTERTADGHPPGYDWRDERSANNFAAELLMPAGWVAEAFRKSDDPTTLANRFDVSSAAIGYRLVNLGLR